ncbi:hypothetical protein QEV83_07675 [Methylocapsa sp. D3K7]|uniref:hypothetical protein n=1 Tax=Methylocapsa sp. D3K7 TaxID=3041435 RepID=UPI00244EAFEE|nr:hypothetical protein [Methylocapsa sp. D3K7]WGJ16112.1 hypothetical protein QEV83_07675 [Methylocapsa sp. D3K7]
MGRRRSKALVTATILTVAVFSSTVATADSQKSRAIDPNTVIAGRTFGDWSAAWWQWALSIPVSSHPLFDNGDCTTGQTGQVFFLGGKFNPGTANATAKRQCTVPNGKNIFFPIVNAVDVFPDPKLGDTINSFRKANQDTIDGTTKLEADLDGRRLDDLGILRFQSTVFDFVVPEGNLFGLPAGADASYIGVDDGVYVMLKPLSPGSHLLHFTGTFTVPSAGSLNITYQLKVSP